MLYRFFYDNDRGITIHIWQKRELENQHPDMGIEKFQIAHDEYLIEWHNSKLKSAIVDPGDTSMGIKQSPVLFMQSGIVEKEHQFLVSYLEHSETEIIKVLRTKLVENH